MYNNGNNERASNRRSTNVSGCACNARSAQSVGTAIPSSEVIGAFSGCGENTNSALGLVGYPLASVYAPLQSFEDIYDFETGLSRGTIFR